MAHVKITWYRTGPEMHPAIFLFVLDDDQISRGQIDIRAKCLHRHET